MALVLCTGVISTSTVSTLADTGEVETVTYKYAVYLGVKDYGTVKSSDKDNFVHRFSIDGEEKQFTVDSSDDYAIQNILAEGYVYDITVSDGEVTAAAESTALAQGELVSVSTDSVTVGTTQIAISDETEIFEITTQAGGATVTAADLTAGESVKVYGDSSADVIYLAFVAEDYEAPVDYTAGETTLKNFLAAAMQPVGTALY
ncbi:MAG: hypothetical protein LUE23_03475, partial [Lachnospiraceae bacterium]|nr:hypothetical protein [Lachnospiraceae bacterium]